MVERQSTVLFDVFSILHRAYHALPPLTTQDGRPVGALYGLIAAVLKIIKDEHILLRPGEDSHTPRLLIACFDGREKTYRHTLYKEYKGTRKAPEDDFIAQIDLCYRFFEAFGIPSFVCPGYEADDIIGTLTDRYSRKGGVRIITSDNDLLQLVNEQVVVLLYSRGTQGILYDVRAVREKFGFDPHVIPDYKGLCGDPSDNIPGVRGIGDIGAKNILMTHRSLEGVYKAIAEGREVVSKRITTLLTNAKKEAFFFRDLTTVSRNVPVKKNIQFWDPDIKSPSRIS